MSWVALVRELHLGKPVPSLREEESEKEEGDDHEDDEK